MYYFNGIQCDRSNVMVRLRIGIIINQPWQIFDPIDANHPDNFSLAFHRISLIPIPLDQPGTLQNKPWRFLMPGICPIKLLNCK